MTKSKDKPRNKAKGCLILLIIICVIAWAISNAESEENKSSKPKGNTIANFWKNYDPNLKSRIDASDCSELQIEFNNAADNSDRQRARTGTGNLDLMNYIEAKMQSKGCH